MSSRRHLLGSHAGLADRRRLYVTDDAFEVDTLEAFYVVRTRMLFDDVLMVSLHRERTVRDWLIFGAAAVVAAVFCAIAPLPDAAIGWAVGLACAAAVLTPAIVLVARGRVIVSIFGRRTMGRASWGFKHSGADAAYRYVVARVTAAQGRVPATAPAAPPPVEPAPTADVAPSVEPAPSADAAPFAPPPPGDGAA